MRFPFNSLVSSFQRRQQSVVKFFRADACPCETIAISYKSEEGNDCRYEFRISAPINVQITFSNGRHISVNSDGRYEISTLTSHDQPPLPLLSGDDEVLSCIPEDVHAQAAFSIQAQ